MAPSPKRRHSCDLHRSPSRPRKAGREAGAGRVGATTTSPRDRKRHSPTTGGADPWPYAPVAPQSRSRSSQEAAPLSPLRQPLRGPLKIWQRDTLLRSRGGSAPIARRAAPSTPAPAGRPPRASRRHHRRRPHPAESSTARVSRQALRVAAAVANAYCCFLHGFRRVRSRTVRYRSGLRGCCSNPARGRGSVLRAVAAGYSLAWDCRSPSTSGITTSGITTGRKISCSQSNSVLPSKPVQSQPCV